MKNREHEAPALLSLSLSQCRFAIYSCIIVRGRTRVRLHKCVSVRADVGVCLRLYEYVGVSRGLTVLVDEALYVSVCLDWPRGQMRVPGISRTDVKDLWLCFDVRVVCRRSSRVMNK